MLTDVTFTVLDKSDLITKHSYCSSRQSKIKGEKMGTKVLRIDNAFALTHVDTSQPQQ